MKPRAVPSSRFGLAPLFAVVLGCSTTTTDPAATQTTGGAPTTPGPSSSAAPTTPASNTPPPPPSTKPGCAQKTYSEALPTSASLASIPFSPAQAEQFLRSAVDLRYPTGKLILEGGIAASLAEGTTSCVTQFLDDRSTAAAVLQQASTVVHECGHYFDLSKGGGVSSSAYVITKDIQFTCQNGGLASSSGRTFARSLLMSDAYAAKRAACAGDQEGCDGYAEIYLTGDSGNQGYDLLLEEAVQYVNSLASALAFKESYADTAASERDGILTFLWYLERYLALARTAHPDAYDLLTKDACWRQATLTVWDRGWFYLDATKGIPELGIEDAQIEPLVRDPALVAEIDALRKLECD